MYKIGLSHPNTQYVHRVLLALAEQQQLQAFYTALYYNADRFPGNMLSYFPKSLANRAAKLLNRRSFNGIDPALIHHFPLLELKRALLKKTWKSKDELWYLNMAAQFDKNTCEHLSKQQTNFDAWIAYEMAAENTFAAFRKKGTKTILDLAQIHYQEIAEIAGKYDGFAYLLKDKELQLRVNQRKERELNLTDYVFCLSSFAKQSMLKHGYAAEQLKVLNLGYDPALFFPAKKEEKAHFDLLYVGTLTKRKGIDLILKAQSILKEKRHKVKLTLVGPMGDAHDLLKQAKLDFTYLPFTPPENLRALYQQADLMVFPSYLDSWAMVVIEAMACGTPVIVSENTGAKDAVAQGGGMVIPTGELEPLLSAIEKYYNNPELKNADAQKAAQIAQNYTWTNYNSQLQAALSSCLS